MQHTSSPNLVRLHIRFRRDHTERLTNLANALAKRKGRDVRLGEALELALTAGFAWNDIDLLDLAPSDKSSLHWLALGPVNRHGGVALTPAALRQ